MGIKVLIGAAIAALSFFLLLILAAIAVPVLMAKSNPADRATAEYYAKNVEMLVELDLISNNSFNRVNDSPTVVSVDDGITLTVPGGTADVTGTSEYDYCVSVTVGSETAAYGPGATAPDEPCQP